MVEEERRKFLTIAGALLGTSVSISSILEEECQEIDIKRGRTDYPEVSKYQNCGTEIDYRNLSKNKTFEYERSDYNGS